MAARLQPPPPAAAAKSIHLGNPGRIKSREARKDQGGGCKFEVGVQRGAGALGEWGVYRSPDMVATLIAAKAAKFGARTLRLALLLGLGSLLVACAGQPFKPSATLRPPKHPAHEVQPPQAETATETASLPETTPAPATIWKSADKLMGLAPEELQAALGRPARIRDEEAGRIYQYIGRDCVLDLFLYAAEAGPYRVSYLEARSVDAERKPVDACLKSLPAPVVANNAPTS